MSATTTTYSPGDRVRVVAPGPYQHREGFVLTDDGSDFLPVRARITVDAGDDDVWFQPAELELIPDPTDPTSTPDDPYSPVGEIIDVVPGALVRQPAGSRRPDPAEVPSSSQAGAAAYSEAPIPLMETPQAARDLMAGAGIDLAGFDRALAQAREGAEEHADRPALAAYDDGHAQGHRDGLIAALRIVERYERVADDQPDYAGAALLGDVRDAIRAEVQA